MSWNATEDDCFLEMQHHSSSPCANAGLRRFSSAEFAASSWSDLLHSPQANDEPVWQGAYPSYAGAEAAMAITASTSMSESTSQEAPIFMRPEMDEETTILCSGEDYSETGEMDPDRLLQDASTVEGDYMVIPPEATHACHHDGEDRSLEASAQSDPSAFLHSEHACVQGTATVVNHPPENVMASIVVAASSNCTTKRRKRKTSQDHEDTASELPDARKTKRARSVKDDHWPGANKWTLEMCNRCDMSEEQRAQFLRDQNTFAAMGHQKKALIQFFHLQRFWQNLVVLEDGADRWAQFRIINYGAFWNGLVELCGVSHEDLTEGTQAWSSLQTAFTRLGYEPAGKSFKPKWQAGYQGDVPFVPYAPKPKRPRATSKAPKL